MAEVEEQNPAAAADSPEDPNEVPADCQEGGLQHLANKSLYVGDLDVSITESQLYDMFGQIGEVTSARVCRDSMSQRSLGYGYVNFLYSHHATEALEKLNFTPVNGKIIRIMYANRDPSLRKSGTANIIIKNLDKTIESKGLLDIFSTFGTILSGKVATDDQGQSMGYGFVHFDSEEAAQTAIDTLNGMLINGKQVYVGHFVRKQGRESDDRKFTNVYVKNLSDTTTEDDLSRIFGEYGTITSAVVMKDGEGKSRRFGFVNYKDSEDAAKAVEALNGRKSDNEEWYVGRAQKKSERVVELKAKFEQAIKESEENNLNLYVKNLHDDVDDDKLKELFSGFGTITSHKVIRNPNGVSRGCGFVAFSTIDEASRALAEMNNKMVNNKPLYVALAQRKEERRKILQAQFAAASPLSSPPTSPIIPPAAPSFGQQLGRPPAPGFGNQFLHGQGLPPVLDFSQPFSYGQGPPAPLDLGHRFFYGQGLPASPLQARFGYQPQFVPRMRPGNGPMNNFYVPHMQPGQHVQRPPGNRLWAGPVLQNQYPVPMMPGSMHRYLPGRNMARVPMPGVPVRLPPIPQGTGSIPLHDPAAGPPMPVPDLSTSLANQSPEQQRLILGGKLYPLVEELEPENVAKVTGMILGLDLHEVLHLLESPEALKAKVDEAMVVLQHKSRSRHQPSNQVIDQLADLSLHDKETAQTPSVD